MTKIEQLQKALWEGNSEADAALITSTPNSRYLSGFSASARLIFVTKTAAYYLTDFRYGEAARKAVCGCEVLQYTRREDTLRQLLHRHAVKRLFLEYSNLNYGESVLFGNLCREAGVTPVLDKTLDKALGELRAVKDAAEIAKIKAAQAITDASFQYILPKLRPGITEREIALELEFFMKRQGAEALAFDLIVVSGENGSQCHGVPGSKRLKQGEFVTMDIGAVVDGYHSDMTRTVALGQISPEQEAVYQTVLRAQTAACDAVRPGIACNQVDFVARSIIDEQYAGTFGHGTGHSVGIEIHEMPAFAPSCTTVTKPGMVITVEPGIYLEGQFGVRIEDMVLVTENGHENLTHSPKELILL